MAINPREKSDWALNSSALVTPTDGGHWMYGWSTPYNNPVGVPEKPPLNEQNYWQKAVHNYRNYLNLAGEEVSDAIPIIRSTLDSMLEPSSLNYIENINGNKITDINSGYYMSYYYTDSLTISGEVGKKFSIWSIVTFSGNYLPLDNPHSVSTYFSVDGVDILESTASCTMWRPQNSFSQFFTISIFNELVLTTNYSKNYSVDSLVMAQDIYGSEDLIGVSFNSAAETDTHQPILRSYEYEEVNSKSYLAKQEKKKLFPIGANVQSQGISAPFSAAVPLNARTIKLTEVSR